MKKKKRMLSLFLAVLIMLSAMPPITASAAVKDLSAYVTITGFNIYNNDGTDTENPTLVDSSDIPQNVTSYGNGLSHWSKKNVEVFWELDLSKAPAGTTISEDDYFTFTLFSEGSWSIGTTASSDITVNELGDSVTAGTWSIGSNRKAKVILGEKAANANTDTLSGTLTTGYICYPSFTFLNDIEKATTIGDNTKYYKYNARTNTATTFGGFAKSMAASTNNSIIWDLHLGRNYLSTVATVASGNSWPGSVANADKMSNLFVIDKIEGASTITAISTDIRTRIYAKGPSKDGYEDFPLGSMDLGSHILTTKFVGVNEGSGDTNGLESFKDTVESATNGVGSYGIYEDTEEDAYYVVWYINSLPTANLTYGSALNGTSVYNYFKNAWSLPDEDESWYDTVYGADDPVYNLLIRYNVTYRDTVLEDKQLVNNGANFYYTTMTGNQQNSIDPSTVNGYMYAATGTAVLPWNSAAIIKYNEDGTLGLGGTTFQLQYQDSSSGGWKDYEIMK